MTTDTRFPTDADFEAELRAMLQRRADDVRLSRPVHPTGWQRVEAETRVISVTGRREHTPPASPHTAVTPLVAAAAVGVVVMGAIGLTIRGTSDGDDTGMVGGSPLDGAEISAPGAEGWDPATAPPVWPVVGSDALPRLDGAEGLGDPATAAEAYLTGLAKPATIDADQVSVSPDSLTAMVPWRFTEQDRLEPDGPATYAGTIYLRAVATPENPVWVVVGAVTDGVALDDVRTDGDRVGFGIVAPAASVADNFSLRVGVDGSWVPLGGGALPQGGVDPQDNEPDPSLGQLITLDANNSWSGEIDVDPGATVDILVRHVGGDMLSVTHMALEVPAEETPAQPPSPAPTAHGHAEATDEQPAGSTTPEPSEPTTDSGATDGEQVTGTYAGIDRYTPTDGKCPDLDHVLTLTFELADGSTWSFRSDICGDLDGDLWTGEGDFVLTTTTRDTITGTLHSSAFLPSIGEPFGLTITGGTGSYLGASGSCTLDNHLVSVDVGTQEQWGDFVCDLSR